MADNLQILVDKLRDKGEHEAAGKVLQANAFYQDVSEFMELEFPHWSEDARQIAAMNFSILMV